MNKVLNDAHILVTRPAHQADNLCRLIEEHGGIPIRFPTLNIVEPDGCFTIRQTLSALDSFQCVCFMSANAVDFALKANSGKIVRSKTVRFAAIGQATAQALKRAGLLVDLLPEDGYNSEGLLAMPQLQHVKGQKILIIRGEGGRDELANTLRSRGAQVEYLDVYKRVIPDIDVAPVLNLLAENKLDVITITSVEALQNLLTMLGKEKHKLLFAVPLVVISERIRNMAADMGFERINVTDSPSDTAIVETVILIGGE
ncbi:MAG: uroporphyrinogen-III synthase [Methylobacter sp.]|nr:uroporphyrinogen-III synthase [Methylobacter sp.]